MSYNTHERNSYKYKNIIQSLIWYFQKLINKILAQQKRMIRL